MTMPRLSKSWCCGLGFSSEQDDCEELTRNVHLTSKVVVAGDGLVGKTCLLMRYVHGQFPEAYQATIFDNQAVQVDVEKKKVLLNLFDTAGQEGYDALRPLMYPNTDVMLICFSVNDRDSLGNVTERWQPEVRRHLPKVPIILVGLKTDLRGSGTGNDGDDAGGDDHIRSPFPNQTSSRSSMSQLLIRDSTARDVSLELQDQCRRCVSYSEGQKVAQRIGAKAYFECSSKRNEGLTAIFYEVAQISLKRRRRSSLCRALSLSFPGRRQFWRAA